MLAYQRAICSNCQNVLPVIAKKHFFLQAAADVLFSHIATCTCIYDNSLSQTVAMNHEPPRADQVMAFLSRLASRSVAGITYIQSIATLSLS